MALPPMTYPDARPGVDPRLYAWRAEMERILGRSIHVTQTLRGAAEQRRYNQAGFGRRDGAVENSPHVMGTAMDIRTVGTGISNQRWIDVAYQAAQNLGFNRSQVYATHHVGTGPHLHIEFRGPRLDALPPNLRTADARRPQARTGAHPPDDCPSCTSGRRDMPRNMGPMVRGPQHMYPPHMRPPHHGPMGDPYGMRGVPPHAMHRPPMGRPPYMRAPPADMYDPRMHGPHIPPHMENPFDGMHERPVAMPAHMPPHMPPHIPRGGIPIAGGHDFSATNSIYISQRVGTESDGRPIYQYAPRDGRAPMMVGQQQDPRIAPEGIMRYPQDALLAHLGGGNITEGRRIIANVMKEAMGVPFEGAAGFKPYQPVTDPAMLQLAGQFMGLQGLRRDEQGRIDAQALQGIQAFSQEVRAAQQEMNAAGMRVAVDGVYGPQTGAIDRQSGYRVAGAAAQQRPPAHMVQPHPGLIEPPRPYAT